jgi:hypothetical protein
MTRPGKAFTIYVDVETAEETRNAVDYLSGPPERMTLKKLATDALHAELARLRKRYKVKGPFPPRPGALKRGRIQQG